jgi:hypothetical protein
MVSVPSFLLKRLYVRGSLTATADGFEFRVENKLGSGYSVEMMPVTLEDQTYFRHEDGRTVLFSQVSAENPFTLEMNKGLTIGVHGATLAPGPHKAGMGFVVQGIGPLKFDVSDVV